MNPESRLQAACAAYLDERDIYYINTHGSAWERRGRPDLFICYRGRFIGCELKQGVGNKPTPLQEKHLRKITQNGGIGIWATSVQELDHLLSSLDLMGDS